MRYVIYQFEGFRGNQSNIITQFIEKYKPDKLIDEEIKIIFNYQKENKKNNNFINILFSLQILINYILENNSNKNELLSQIISSINSQNKKDENMQILYELFNNKEIQNKNLFKVNSLMNIFNIFELLCWDKIKENLEKEYKTKLNETIIKKFDSFYANKENERYITKIKLATALRRFISRYLTGKRNEKESKEKKKFNALFKKRRIMG